MAPHNGLKFSNIPFCQQTKVREPQYHRAHKTCVKENFQQWITGYYVIPYLQWVAWVRSSFKNWVGWRIGDMILPVTEPTNLHPTIPHDVLNWLDTKCGIITKIPNSNYKNGTIFQEYTKKWHQNRIYQALGFPRSNAHLKHFGPRYS